MAVHNIAEGALNVTIKNGVDPRDYSLVAYCAAGLMMLPAVLDAVHVKQVIVRPFPGLFSALGLLSADQVYTVNRSAYILLAADIAPQIHAMFTEMEAELLEHANTGVQVTLERAFDGHLAGQSWDAPFVPVPSGAIDEDAIARMTAAFHDTYYARSGNRFDHMEVEGVTFRVRAVLETPRCPIRRFPLGAGNR